MHDLCRGFVYLTCQALDGGPTYPAIAVFTWNGDAQCSASHGLTGLRRRPAAVCNGCCLLDSCACLLNASLFAQEQTTFSESTQGLPADWMDSALQSKVMTTTIWCCPPIHWRCRTGLA
jgi:hypothetical protein